MDISSGSEHEVRKNSEFDYQLQSELMTERAQRLDLLKHLCLLPLFHIGFRNNP